MRQIFNWLQRPYPFEKHWPQTLRSALWAGASTLVTGPIAIFYNFKDPRKHRVVGKTFFYAMLVVGVSAILAFFKHPERVFFQFLLGIALLVLAGVFRGVRSIFLMKGGRVLPFDFAYTALLGLNALSHFLPWYLQWFGPTLLLLPVQIYFGRKLRAMRGKALSRMGVA